MRLRDRAVLVFLVGHLFCWAPTPALGVLKANRVVDDTEGRRVFLAEDVKIFDFPAQDHEGLHSSNVPYIRGIQRILTPMGDWNLLPIEDGSGGVFKNTASVNLCLDRVVIRTRQRSYQMDARPHIESWRLSIVMQHEMIGRRFSCLRQHYDGTGEVGIYPSSFAGLEVVGSKFVCFQRCIPLALVDVDGVDSDAEGGEFKESLPEAQPLPKSWFLLGSIALLLGAWGWTNLREGCRLPWSGICFLLGLGLWGWAMSLATGVSLF